MRLLLWGFFGARQPVVTVYLRCIENLLLFSTEVRKSYGFGSTWGRVNDDRILTYSFEWGWNFTVNYIHISTDAYVCVVSSTLSLSLHICLSLPPTGSFYSFSLSQGGLWSGGEGSLWRAVHWRERERQGVVRQICQCAGMRGATVINHESNHCMTSLLNSFFILGLIKVTF